MAEAVVIEGVSVVESKGPIDTKKLADVLGPAQMDLLIRQALQICWMNLPNKRRKHPELKKQIQRLVDRALRDFREDQKEMGK